MLNDTETRQYCEACGFTHDVLDDECTELDVDGIGSAHSVDIVWLASLAAVQDLEVRPAA